MKRQQNSNLEALLRLFIAVMAVFAQIFLFIWLTRTLMNAGTYIYSAIQIFSVFTIIKLVNRHESPSYKIAWLLVIFMLPVFGLFLYFLWGRANHRRFRRLQEHDITNALWDPENTADSRTEACIAEHPELARIVRFLHHHGFPVYPENKSTYYPLGDFCFDALCEDLEKAERFIFLEFFIVSEGFLWDKVAKILREKAVKGVEILFLIDDFGAVKLSRKEKKRLTEAGVKWKTFNPILRHVSNLYLNYRNHQKIIVIDGKAAYTGGVNLADEYVNMNRKHGHWKDTAVRVIGEGVWSLTLAFLQMWHINDGSHLDRYLNWRNPVVSDIPETAGYYQPFTDGPSNNPHNPAKAVCQQMIESADRYVWITSPYLILEEDMLESLTRAAESGVDVRIITPSVPDKWYVHLVTRSHYGRLMHSGVKIYEYTPGFMHAKMIVSDDTNALVGTVNFDFRSFYLQYENAVWFCNSGIVLDVHDDFLQTLQVCQEMTFSDWQKRPIYQKAAATFFRMFSTLM